MIRDPMSADRNAEAPEGHPQAQVRVDQSTKLTGVQPVKYASDAPKPEPAPAPASVEAAPGEGSEGEETPAPVGEEGAGGEPVEAVAPAEPVAVTGDGVVLSGEDVPLVQDAQPAPADEAKPADEESAS